jgi:hypothetical protein
MSLSMSEELKTRETQLDEVRKQVGQWESKLKQQQQLYEAVRSDRNHYSKGTATCFLTAVLLHYGTMYCTMLYCTVLYCTVLFCSVVRKQYCTAMYRHALQSTSAFCTVLPCTVLTVYAPL